MTFDQLVKELMKLSDQDPADFERIKDDLIQELHERGLSVGRLESRDALENFA